MLTSPRPWLLLLLLLLLLVVLLIRIIADDGLSLCAACRVYTDRSIQDVVLLLRCRAKLTDTKRMKQSLISMWEILKT